MTSRSVLRLDSSSSTSLSATRLLSDLIVEKLAPAQVTRRDLAAEPLPIVTRDWITGRMKAPSDQTDIEKNELLQSEALVAELLAADTIVIGVPVYNFGIPAALKAWIDLVVRPGLTFAFTADGVKPLVHDKRVILAYASGSTAVGGETDFATSYLRLVLGFIGMTNIEIISADLLAFDREGRLEKAKEQIAALAV